MNFRKIILIFIIPFFLTGCVSAKYTLDIDKNLKVSEEVFISATSEYFGSFYKNNPITIVKEWYNDSENKNSLTKNNYSHELVTENVTYPGVLVKKKYDNLSEYQSLIECSKTLKGVHPELFDRYKFGENIEVLYNSIIEDYIIENNRIGGVILKNALGVVGIIVILGICVMPVIKLGILTLIYNLAAGIIEPVSDEKIVKLLEEMGGTFKLLFGILCVLSAMLIIGVTLVVKISNSGMMYK
mgnify:CR=1 FL=1